MTSLTEFCVFLHSFHFNFRLNTGSVCLPGVRLPCRASLRRRRRVHPGILRILRQPHLQVDRLIGRSIADFLYSQKSSTMFKKFILPPLFRPYGFGAWGVGSKGFGYNTMVSSPNSFYGGYHYAG